MKRKHLLFTIGKFLPFILFTLFLLFKMAHNKFVFNQRMNSWGEIEGKVINKKVIYDGSQSGSIGNNHAYNVEIEYVYRVNSMIYTNNGLLALVKSFKDINMADSFKNKIGSHVIVKYNPASPNESFAIRK